MNTIMSKMIKLVLLLSTMAVLTACQSMNAPIKSATANENGENWLLTKGTINGQTLLIDNEFKITLALYENQALVGKSAINNYRAPVKINGHKIEHTGPVITTMMAGPSEMMRLESDYLSAINEVDTINRNGDKLLITGDDIELHYVITTDDKM